MTHLTGKILLISCIFCLAFCTKNADSQLIVWGENAVVRMEPDDRSVVIQMLDKGDRVRDMDETASSESVFYVSKVIQQSPWIKIGLPNGQSGWVLAWSVKPLNKDSTWLLKKRMDTYWRKGLRLERDKWLEGFRAIKDQEDWFSVFRQAVHLRDTMVHMLQQRPDNGDQMTFHWMAELFPGFILQQSSGTRKPQLYADYRIWLEKAINSSGRQDDALARHYCSLFPVDSIESKYPVWLFQIGEEEYASQLGLGRHDHVLRSLDTLLREAPMAKLEIMAVKSLILEDILDHDRSYWQASEKILLELQGIINHPPACLSANEIEAVSIRSKMFEQPDLNGIRVNLRSGG